MTARYFFILLLLCAPAALAASLPLPRWASLKSDDINARTGPGTRYPIAWVYRKSGLPVEIIEEFGAWRRIRDADGTVGWVHESMLSGKRYVLVAGKEAHVVRFDPKDSARPMMKVDPKVIARLVECRRDWCRIQAAGHKGWVEKKYLWGVYPSEVVE